MLDASCILFIDKQTHKNHFVAMPIKWQRCTIRHRITYAAVWECVCVCLCVLKESMVTVEMIESKKKKSGDNNHNGGPLTEINCEKTEMGEGDQARTHTRTPTQRT